MSWKEFFLKADLFFLSIDYNAMNQEEDEKEGAQLFGWYWGKGIV